MIGEVVCEVGSGLDGKRPKLRRLLSDPSATVVVVEHRDGLAWFGVEHLEAALGGHGRRIVVADAGESDARRRAAGEAEELELAEAYGRVINDGGGTDGWAAGVLHAAAIGRIELGGGTVVPVLPPRLKVVR